MEMLAVRVPMVIGVKVTEMLQDVAAPTLEPQLFVCAKSPGSGPVIVMLAMLKTEVPILVSVVAWGELVLWVSTRPKFMLYGTISTVPAVSVMATVSVLAGLLKEAAVIVTEGLLGRLAGAL
jgi:hypothetical protein